jgi:Nif-specific regulatory protein
VAALPHGDLKTGLLDAVEREMIEQAMQQCNGVVIKAADRIGINRNTLSKKLEEYRGTTEAS